MIIEKNHVVIVGQSEDLPTECPECRTKISMVGGLASGVALYECHYKIDEKHHVWAVAEWLSVHIMQALDQYLQNLEAPDIEGDEQREG